MRKTQQAEFSAQQIWQHQLITIGDLTLLKTQILDEIRALFQAHPQQAEASGWLKSSEVQKLLKISRGKLFGLRSAGTLPYTRVGGVIYYKRGDIDKMLEANKAGI